MRIFVFLPVMPILFLAGCTPNPDDELTKNKEVVERFVQISNDANWDQLAEVMTADFRRHSAATAGEPVRSLQEFVTLQKGFLTTFPDQHVRLDYMIAEGDHVAIRAAYTGTQSGPMGEFPPSGNKVDGPFIAFFRIESGKIAELWVEWDNVSMLTQLQLLSTKPSEDVDAERKKLAIEFLRGIYTGDPSVVERIAAPDIVVSYPIFDEIFQSPVIRGREAVRQFAVGFDKRWIDATVAVRHAMADRNTVVLVWEFQARSADMSNSGEAESTMEAWGGVTLYRFNDGNQIVLELGEESTPGPLARVPSAFD